MLFYCCQNKLNEIETLMLLKWHLNLSSKNLFCTCGLFYKHVTIVNDNSSVISKYSFKLSDDPRVVIYDGHRFIIQVIDYSATVLAVHDHSF